IRPAWAVATWDHSAAIPPEATPPAAGCAAPRKILASSATSSGFGSGSIAESWHTRRVTAQLPGWRHAYSGKVRDLYAPEDGSDRILVVASDRISAYDHILPTPIPDKG